MRSKSTWPSRIAVAVALTLFVGACSGDSNSESGNSADKSAEADAGLFPAETLNRAQHEGTPTVGGKVTYGLESAVGNVSPNQDVIAPAELQLVTSVFDPLISYGDDDEPVLDNTDHKANQLAEKIESSDDLKTWTVTLREDIQFSNGEPLTAQQVVSHTNWIKDTGTCSCDVDAQNIADIQATDDHTVVYKLSAPNVAWPTKLATGLGWITEEGARGDESSPGIDQLIGTGPFAYKDHTGDTYTVVRNEHYYGKDVRNDDHELPYLDEIVFRPLADGTTRLDAVESGGVQIMQTADTSNLVAAKRNDDLVVQPITGSSTTIIVLRLTNEPFGVNPEPGESTEETAKRGLEDEAARLSREAFLHSINRNEINQKHYLGSRVPAYSFIPSSSFYYSEDGQLPRFDPDKAKELVQASMDERGQTAPPSLKAICINTPESTAVFTILREQAEDVGIDAELVQLDQVVMVNALLAGTEDGQAEGWNLACFRSGQLSDPDGIYGALHSTGAVNLVKYQHADVDQWLADARKVAEPAERKVFYDQIQEQVAQDAIYVPLLYDFFGNVHTQNISGLGKPRPDSLGLIPLAGLYYVAD